MNTISLRINIASLIVLMFLISSCGIDSIQYLSDKPVYISNTGKACEFKVSSDAIFFYGVDLYYRIYTSEEKANSDRSVIEAKQSSDNTPGSSRQYLINTLKYHRPTGVSLKKPVVNSRIPTIQESSIIEPPNFISILWRDGRIFLDVDSTDIISEAEIYTDDYSDEDVYELLRDTGNGSPVQFNVLPETGDIDFQDDNGTTGNYYVQFFAVSYGFDIAGSGAELYSNAVWLGQIELESGG